MIVLSNDPIAFCCDHGHTLLATGPFVSTLAHTQVIQIWPMYSMDIGQPPVTNAVITPQYNMIMEILCVYMRYCNNFDGWMGK